MKKVQLNNLNKCDSLKSYTQHQRLSDALRLLDGISRLPLQNDPNRRKEICEIFREAKKAEKK